MCSKNLWDLLKDHQKKKLKFAFSVEIDGKDFGICAIGHNVKQPKAISSWRYIRNDRH